MDQTSVQSLVVKFKYKCFVFNSEWRLKTRQYTFFFSIGTTTHAGLCLHNGPQVQGHISGSLTGVFLIGWGCQPHAQPTTQRTRSHIHNPWDWVVQLYPQTLVIHFSRLLLHPQATVGLFFNSSHHMGHNLYYSYFLEQVFNCVDCSIIMFGSRLC